MRPPSRGRGFPTKIAGILDSVLEKKHLKKRIKDCEVFEIWDDVVGENIATRTAPLGFRKGTLKIGVSDHGWLQQLQFMKEETKAKLNEKLGRALVEDIYFQVGNIEKEVASKDRVMEEMKKVILLLEEILQRICLEIEYGNKCFLKEHMKIQQNLLWLLLRHKHYMARCYKYQYS